MSTYNTRCALTFEAAGDLSANQFYLVVVDGNGQVAVAGDGADAIGVLYDKPSAQGNAAQVRIGEVVQVAAGAAVSIGANVASDATGRAVTATTGEQIVGKALTAASAAGQLISVLWRPNGTSA